MPRINLHEPKPTFCIYDSSEDSDVENNNIKDSDIESVQYFECYLGKGKLDEYSKVNMSK